MEALNNTDEAKVWRNGCVKWFMNHCDNVKCIAPTDYYNYENNDSKNGLEIMRFDLHKVAKADVILVNMNHIRKSIGTCDEIFYAWMLKKPIIGFVDDDLNGVMLEKLIHPWKFWQATRIESGENAMYKALLYIKDYYLR